MKKQQQNNRHVAPARGQRPAPAAPVYHAPLRAARPAPGRSRRMYLAGAGLVLVAVVVAVADPFHGPAPAAGMPVLVRTETVGAAGDGERYVYSGEVRGRYESQLAFQVGGKVARRLVEAGSAVRAGDTLFELDPQDVRQGLAAAEAQHQAAQAQAVLAKATWTRYKTLYDAQAISKMDYERVFAAYDTAAAQARAAKAQLDQLGNQMGYTRLVAGAAGVIASVHAEIGQVVGAGQPVAVLVHSGELDVAIGVPENRVADVAAWGRVTVTFWALPDAAVPGMVRSVAPMADPASRTYKVRVGLLGPPAGVRCGMTASVAAGVAARRTLPSVPLSAIHQGGDEPGVWVVKDGTVCWRPVRLKRIDDERVQVLSGLADGEVVVTAGVHRLRAGQRVRTAGGA